MKQLKFLTSIPLTYDSYVIQKSTDHKIYKNAILFTPGSWTDSVSAMECYYSPEVISRCAEIWPTRYINLQHSHNPIDFVGSVYNQHWDGVSLKGDLHLFRTGIGEHIITLIDAGIINKLSVEANTEDSYDRKLMIRSTDDMEFLGVSIIGHIPAPACKDARIV